MFLFRETDIKLCKNYTKTLYIRFRIKVVVLNRSYSTNIQRYCTAIGGSSGEVIRIIYILYVIIFAIFSKKIWDSQSFVEYGSFQIGCVFVEYYLFNTTCLLQNLIYIRFGIILTPFYIKFSRQEHQIDVYRSTPEILRFQPLPPFIFPLQFL